MKSNFTPFFYFLLVSLFSPVSLSASGLASNEKNNSKFSTANFKIDPEDFMTRVEPLRKKINLMQGNVSYMLLGESGGGKSTTANYLKGKEMFAYEDDLGDEVITCKNPDPKIGAQNVDSETNSISAHKLKGYNGFCIDTPGLNDTSLDPAEKLIRSASIALTSRVIKLHALVIVIPGEDSKIKNKFQKLRSSLVYLKGAFPKAEKYLSSIFFFYTTNSNKLTRKNLFKRLSIFFQANDVPKGTILEKIYKSYPENILLVRPIDPKTGKTNVALRNHINSKLNASKKVIPAGSFCFNSDPDINLKLGNYVSKHIKSALDIYYRAKEFNNLIEECGIKIKDLKQGMRRRYCGIASNDSTDWEYQYRCLKQSIEQKKEDIKEAKEDTETIKEYKGRKSAAKIVFEEVDDWANESWDKGEYAKAYGKAFLGTVPLLGTGIMSIFGAGENQYSYKTVLTDEAKEKIKKLEEEIESKEQYRIPMHNNAEDQKKIHELKSQINDYKEHLKDYIRMNRKEIAETPFFVQMIDLFGFKEDDCDGMLTFLSLYYKGIPKILKN